MTVEYQKCPICEGRGRVIANAGSTIAFTPCDVCHGSKMVPKHVLPVPQTTLDDTKRETKELIMDIIREVAITYPETVDKKMFLNHVFAKIVGN